MPLGFSGIKMCPLTHFAFSVNRPKTKSKKDHIKEEKNKKQIYHTDLVCAETDAKTPS